VLTPNGVGAATGELPDNYVMVSRWMDQSELDMWTNNGGTAIPAGVGGDRVYVTSLDAPQPGGTGPIRADFAVPQSSLGQGGNSDWFQIFQPVQRTPIYNFRANIPPSN
jgi:filamentous hemagglutinin